MWYTIYRRDRYVFHLPPSGVSATRPCYGVVDEKWDVGVFGWREGGIGGCMGDDIVHGETCNKPSFRLTSGIALAL